MKNRVLRYSIPIIVLLTLVITVPTLLSPPQRPINLPQGDYSYAIDYAEYRIKKLIRKYDLPSVAVAIVDDQETIFSSVTGISNVQLDHVADSDTIYRVGSISKVFTALEIMKLHEEGLIDLDAPITDYLPDFSIKTRYNVTIPITIRHILAHRSGLPRNSDFLLWYWDPGPENVLREQVASVKESYTAYPAGYRYKYSNFAYNVLGRIIEVVRGQWFPVALSQDFFEPLGMNSSAFQSGLLNPSADIAEGHYYQDRKNIAYNNYDIITMASGNLLSNVRDLSTFMKWVFRGGDSIMQNETLYSMFQDQYSRYDDPMTNGLGFFTDRSNFNGELMVFHEGTNDGTESSLFMFPNLKVGLVVIANSVRFNEDNKAFLIDILKVLYETKTGNSINLDQKQPISVENNALSQYTGTYVMYDNIEEINLKRNKLKTSIWGLKFSLVPIGSSTFELQHWLLGKPGFEIRFFDDFAILGIMGLDYKFCSKYPDYEEIPEEWDAFMGVYDILPRKDSIYTQEWIEYSDEILEENMVLQFDSTRFHLKTINSTEAIILSGPFDGETIIRDPETGDLWWQNLLYRHVS